jgi:hypothetical protein
MAEPNQILNAALRRANANLEQSLVAFLAMRQAAETAIAEEQEE